jgi:hypothetical protein
MIPLVRSKVQYMTVVYVYGTRYITFTCALFVQYSYKVSMPCDLWHVDITFCRKIRVA